ncbi:MAG: hypothetical protein QOF77_1617 [Solirubrobacteraceae bacterium]|nr:hypothetical protein [Solirubrobacteraceae bacterium]
MYDPSEYGEKVGADYDLLYPEAHLDSAPTVAALARLAATNGSSRSILEFGIGTGRLGLTLLEAGFTVAGIEGSEVMLAQLRAKPRGREIDVVVGDYATARVDGAFSVVVLPFNGIFGLPTRQSQIDCFANAARHLEPGGCFVIEAFVLRPEQLGGEWTMRPRSIEHEHVELELSRYGPAPDHVERTLVHLRPDGVRFLALTDNYAWPGELDLMAAAAGLHLRARHGGWLGEGFDVSSRTHVSIYEAAQPAQ